MTAYLKKINELFEYIFSPKICIMLGMAPQKFREIVLQLLFSLDMGGDESVIPFVMQKAAVARSKAREGFELAQLIWKQRDQFDQKIAATSKEYALDRIPTIEKNILRFALHEMAIEPPALVMKEAIRLAKKFSTPEAGNFINAILHELSPQEGEAVI